MNDKEAGHLSRPKMSIGFPVRNGGAMLIDALDMLMNQSEQDFEIIVSDNASNDGSTEILVAAAAADSRIRYFRQEQALSAYDNFRFVLGHARGPYFMWAAHDDSRTLNYVAYLIDALERNSNAVVAFGDLNIVTPTTPTGVSQAFDFATTELGLLTRLAKISRLQCFYIYGVWRTEAIRRVPYAYCVWWPDLPMMLAAGVLGTFAYAPGATFGYFQVPKSNLYRIKSQDYRATFSLPIGVAGMIRATYLACYEVGGLLVAAYCVSLVVLKQLINLPGFLYRRLKRLAFSPAHVK